MSFTQPALDPVDGLRNTTAYITRPSNETDARAQIQGVIDQVVDLIKQLISELESTTGTSGAENIGSKAIDGVTGTTVYAQLADLKSKIDALVAVSVPSGSIDNDKLATDVKIGSLAALTTTDKSSIQAAINEVVGSLSALASTVAGLSTPTIGTSNISDKAVTTAKIADQAVSTDQLADYSITPVKLNNIYAMPLDTGDYLTYNQSANELKLSISGCTPVSLVPVVYGTSATPPSGTFPKGTIYIQHGA
jgi:hypothetical protein